MEQPLLDTEIEDIRDFSCLYLFQQIPSRIKYLFWLISLYQVITFFYCCFIIYEVYLFIIIIFKILFYDSYRKNYKYIILDNKITVLGILCLLFMPIYIKPISYLLDITINEIKSNIEYARWLTKVHYLINSIIEKIRFRQNLQTEINII
jgi:hypothetical protein